jgi:hypothetical protein
MTQQQSQEEAHRILWGNVQSLREALRALGEDAIQSGDNDGSQARLFIESMLAEIPSGSSLEALWYDLELLYRKTTALVVEENARGNHRAAMTFMGSAAMILAMIKPDLSEDERDEFLMASLDKRAEEQAMQ